jgi:hypothetical protein
MNVPQGLSRLEQETFLRMNEEDQEWEYYGRGPRFKRLLERRGYTVTEDHQGLWVAKLPYRAISVRSANRKPVLLSDAERQRRADSLRNLRKNKTLERKAGS